MKATVSISRCSDGTIRLMVEDELSRIEFLEAVMTPENFGNAVTGLSFQDADVTVRGLEFVGKRRIREKRTVRCPLSCWTKRGELEEWLEINGKERGWIVETYLGSQGSITDRTEDGCTLHYNVVKFVDAGEKTE